MFDFGATLTSNASEDVKGMVLASWAQSTQKSYNSYLSRWYEYCISRHIPPVKATVNQGLEFLMYLFNAGEKHGYISNARSALSAILPVTNTLSFGKLEIVKRFMKGVYKRRPSFPRNVVMYDANIVLDYIASLPANEHLLLEDLTKKLCTLLCLLSGQRAQAIPALTLNMCYRDPISAEYILYVDKIMKTSTPNNHVQPLELEAFPEDPKLCIVRCLDEYIDRTGHLRENNGAGGNMQLILSYHTSKPVGKASIARYVKTFLGEAGIDITVFTCHSTRSASTSKANNLGLSFKDIAKAAGWKSESTFQKFYNKPLRQTLGKVILKGKCK